MTEERQKNDLEPLPPEGGGAGLPDEELFAGAVYEELSTQQIFAGEEDFCQTTENSPGAVSRRLSDTRPKIEHTRPKRASKILIGMLILIVPVVLFYGVQTCLSLLPAADPPAASTPSQTETFAPPQKPEILLNEDHPVSLKTAQDYYLQDDYSRACAVYQQLLEKIPPNTEEDGVRDFLMLKMALCKEKTADDEQSTGLLKAASQSRSVMVRVLANYHLCRLEMKRRQYLTARARAYQTLALLDAIGPHINRLKHLRRNCYFLAAEAVSRQAFLLSDVDQEAPENLWPLFDTEDDPLSDVDEPALRDILNAGSQQLNQSLLGPKIEAGGTDGSRNWTVNCNGASIDEVMSRFSANAGYDVHWGMDVGKTGVRERSVSLYMTAATDRQCITVAAGCAGLVVILSEKNVITIYNPMEYAYVSEQIALLCEEAVSCWQQFLLVYYEDPYLVNIHFALGLLRTAQGRLAEALPEYKMVANRFANSDLAPDALMHSAKLKIGLQDYSGAYSDFKEAVEQYPDYEDIDRAYLLLADTAARVGRREEAAKLYAKVYYLKNAAETQSAAAMAAGQIFYQDGDFTNVEKWLTRYIALTKDHKDHRFYQVCLLLGKTWRALGNSQAACDALRTALSGNLPSGEVVEAVAVLVEEYIAQDHFTQAIDLIDETSCRQLSQEESVQMLLLKSRVFRGMGLIDKAIVMLCDREEYLLDNALKAHIGYELGECYSEQGELDLACKKLTKTLEWAAAGPMTHKTLYKLADVCVQSGLDAQAESVCLRLLSLEPPEPMKQETLALLAAVYQKQKNYDRAALAFLGQWQ